MTKKQLQKILKDHVKWINNEWWSRADFSWMYLVWANFSWANLRGADFSWADFWGADFWGVDLSMFNICPEWDFIGYKKAQWKVIKLKILGDSVNSIGSRKCRTNKVRVLEIEWGLKEVCSDRNSNFIYKLWKIVNEKDYDPDNRLECSKWIHFFITRQEAENR